MTRRNPPPARESVERRPEGGPGRRSPGLSRRFAFAAFGVVLAAALAGCSPFSRPQPVRETYLLQPAPPKAGVPSQRGELRVDRIRVAEPFRGRAFVFRTDALKFESNYYFEFLVEPAAMMTDDTVRALETARPFAQVSGPGSGIDATWRLDAFVSALYADVRDPAHPAAEIDITYYLIPERDAQRTPVWTREYRKRSPMRDATPEAYAAALNAGFGVILDELASDLGQVKLPAH